jgi:hypothetical protein
MYTILIRNKHAWKGKNHLLKKRWAQNHNIVPGMPGLKIAKNIPASQINISFGALIAEE